jgi:hypothetical protein
MACWVDDIWCCRWFYLNSFYPPDSITLPYSLIEAAVGLANVIGAPLAAFLLMLDGLKGLRGWQVMPGVLARSQLLMTDPNCCGWQVLPGVHSRSQLFH